MIERILGVATSPHDFVERFRADPTLLYLIGRLTSAILGASTVPLVYVIATRVRGRSADGGERPATRQPSRVSVRGHGRRSLRPGRDGPRRPAHLSLPPAHLGFSPARGYGYYLAVLRWGIGWPILLAAAGGLAWALRQRDRALLVLASRPLVLYGVMGFERMYFARFILPAVPPLLILAATALHSCARWAQARARVPHNAVLAAASFVLIAPTALDAVRFDGILTREDTRTEARCWIESHLPKGTRIALEDFPFGPPWHPSTTGSSSPGARHSTG